MKTEQVKFLSKVEKTDGCWIWKGRLMNKGRAYFKIGEKYHIAARWLWINTYGPLADGSCVLHECDNPACVRIEHLFIGTQLENIADRDAKGRNRLRSTCCAKGHALVPSNVRTKGPKGTWRVCRECGRQATARYREKSRGLRLKSTPDQPPPQHSPPR